MNELKKHLLKLLVGLFFFLPVRLFAQQKISGVITNKDNKPLAGATVTEKGTRNSTTTDSTGSYSITVSGKPVLVVTYIGMISQEVAAGSSKIINLSLASNPNALDEVVVTAMGFSKQRKALSYAITEIKADQITKAGTDNLGSALQGKVAGLQINNTSGGPMAGTRLNLRGINTLDGTQRPLIIIDGIPYNDDEDGYAGRGFAQGLKGSALNNINPDDIASISVLKGANAAALYGSQALGGVLLITTKRGKAGKGIGVELSSEYTYNKLAYFPERQNEYGNGSLPYWSTFNAQGAPVWASNTTANNFGPRLDGTMVQWWDGQMRPWIAQPDNYKSLFEDGYTNNNTVSISGGSEKGTIRMSLTNFNYGGFLPNMKQQRNSINLNSTYNVSSKLRLEASVNYNITENTNPNERLDRASNYPMPVNEITSLYKEHYQNADGYFLSDSLKKYINSNVRDNIVLPLIWDQYKNNIVANNQQLAASLKLNYQVAQPLSLNLVAGTTRSFYDLQRKEAWKQPSDPTIATDLQGLYQVQQSNSLRNYYQGFLNYNNKIGSDFNLSLAAGGSIDYRYDKTTTTTTSGLKFRDTYSFANNKQANLAPSGSQGGEIIYAAIGTGELSYKNYLFLNTSVRNDWSSKLPDYSRSYFYPSVGLSLILSEVVDLPAVINYAKLRSSYAVVGNTVPSRYFANAGYTYGSFQLPNGSTVITSSIPTSIPPTTIIAEKNYSTELGIEASFFNSRLNVDLTAYFNKGKDLINTVTVAPSSSAANVRINSGTMSNKGFEFQLNGDLVRKKDLTWNLALNGTTISRKVNSLADGLKERLLSNPFSANFMAIPGQEPYQIYMRKLMRDETGNLVVGTNGHVQFDPNYSYIANALPKFYGGISNTVRYRNFSLSAVLDYTFGAHIVSYSNSFMLSSGVAKQSLFGRDTEHGGISYYADATGKNIRLQNGESAPAGFVTRTDGIIVDGVQADGKKNDVIVSAVSYYGNRYGNFGSEESVYKNDYIRLGEVTLSYQLADRLASKIKMNRLMLSLIARNLAYLHKTLPNLAPSTVLGTNSVNSSFEYTVTPGVRNFGFSIKANF